MAPPGGHPRAAGSLSPGGFFWKAPCPTLNGTRRATMPQVLTLRSEPKLIHPSSPARSPAPSVLSPGGGVGARLGPCGNAATARAAELELGLEPEGFGSLPVGARRRTCGCNPNTGPCRGFSAHGNTIVINAARTLELDQGTFSALTSAAGVARSQSCYGSGTGGRNALGMSAFNSGVNHDCADIVGYSCATHAWTTSANEAHNDGWRVKMFICCSSFPVK